jgi:molybdopterin molybdotransferase
LTVVGTAFAGNAFSGQVGKGQAVRIMTGAVLPAGADTVVVQEVTRVESGAVFIPSGQRNSARTPAGPVRIWRAAPWRWRQENASARRNWA